MTSQTNSHLLVSRVVRTSSEIQSTISLRKNYFPPKKFHIHLIIHKFYHIIYRTEKTIFGLAPNDMLLKSYDVSSS